MYYVCQFHTDSRHNYTYTTTVHSAKNLLQTWPWHWEARTVARHWAMSATCCHPALNSGFLPILDPHLHQRWSTVVYWSRHARCQLSSYKCNKQTVSKSRSKRFLKHFMQFAQTQAAHLEPLNKYYRNYQLNYDVSFFECPSHLVLQFHNTNTVAPRASAHAHTHSDTLSSSSQYQFGDRQQNQSTEVHNSAHSVRSHACTLRYTTIQFIVSVRWQATEPEYWSTQFSTFCSLTCKRADIIPSCSQHQFADGQ